MGRLGLGGGQTGVAPSGGCIDADVPFGVEAVGTDELGLEQHNAAITAGKRLPSNALLSYEQTLGRAEGIVKLTVNLTRQIAVIGRAGSDNALDIFYTLTFGRPGTPAERSQPTP